MAVGYVVAAAVCAAISVIVGYFAYAASWGDSGISFNAWVWRPLEMGGWQWALFGALVGVALQYLLAGQKRA